MIPLTPPLFFHFTLPLSCCPFKKVNNYSLDNSISKEGIDSEHRLFKNTVCGKTLPDSNQGNNRIISRDFLLFRTILLSDLGEQVQITTKRL